MTDPPVAAGLLTLGANTLRESPEKRSWPMLGPGLALATIPSLLAGLYPAPLWRVTGLGVLAVVLVILGATRRIQAPLVLGSAIAIIHGIAQLWPWITRGHLAVPWWLWAGLAGALLIYIAARYEKQKAALQTAYATIVSLR